MNKEKELAIKTYFRRLDRSQFMDIYKSEAHRDSPVPIGHGQTISQPTLVLYMTELLDPEEDSHVLEIGTGSGYQTAFLSHFSKSVVTVERIEALHDRARERMEAMGYDNISFVYGDGSVGYEEGGPYDRIMVTAAASTIPEELLEQLKPGGIMIIPVGDSRVQELLRVTKDLDDSVEKERIELVRFVPLVGKYEI